MSTIFWLTSAVILFLSISLSPSIRAVVFDYLDIRDSSSFKKPGSLMTLGVFVICLAWPFLGFFLVFIGIMFLLDFVLGLTWRT